MAGHDLSPAELARYARHVVLPGVGVAGQRRLARARVAIVGAGGLGSPVALYLAAAGVGTLGLVDDDVVDASNLQRQLLHGTGDVGRPKVESAAARLADVNPHVRVEPHAVRLSSANALEILGAWDVVVDGTDNFATRYLVNDACVLLGRPNVWGSVFRFEGQASVFAHADGPCYRCVFPEPPAPDTVPSCAEGGVFGVLPGLVGTIQATEVLKLLLGGEAAAETQAFGESLVGRLLVVDALRMTFRDVRLRRDPACPACGTRTLRTLVDHDAWCAGREPAGAPARTSAATSAAEGASELSPADVAAMRARGEAFELVDVREPWEHAIARLPGAVLMPMGGFPGAADALDPARPVVVACHHGVRSARVAAMLRAAGFRRVWNMAGGIDRWSAEVDASMPRY